MTAKKRTKPPHEPTEAKRNAVLLHLASGATLDTIADVLSISKPTLRKYYRRELNVGFAEMNAKVTGKLFNRCMEGSDTALIWWDKSRNGMSERKQTDLTNSDGSLRPQVIELVAPPNAQNED